MFFVKLLNFIKNLINNLFFYEFENDLNINNETIYQLKNIMSNYEYKFYNSIKELEINYIIIPQLNLASVVSKINNNRYYTDLFRNIDFAIFSKDYKDLILLIEINDKSHEKYKRKDRDLKVKKICNDIGVKLITFYTNYPNEKEYVLNRIKKEIDNYYINKRTSLK